jgi:hypothetical protein
MPLGEEPILLLLKRDPHFFDANLTQERSFVVSLFQKKKLLLMLRTKIYSSFGSRVENFPSRK